MAIQEDCRLAPSASARGTLAKNAENSAVEIALILIALLAAHGIMLTRALVWDDPMIRDQMHLLGRWRLFSADPFGFVRPGKILIFSLYDVIWGDNAVGWMYAAFVTLAATTFACWRLAKAFLPRQAALLAAIVYAVHPLHVEDTGWAAASNGLWMTFFAILYLIVLLKDAAQPRLRHLLVATMLAFCSIFMKEDGVVVPLIGLLCLHFHGYSLSKRILWAFAAQMILAGALILVTRHISSESGQQLLTLPYSGWITTLSSPRMVLQHIFYFCFPFYWAYYRHVSDAPLAYFPLLILGLVVMVFFLRQVWRRRPRFSFPLFCFIFAILALAPSMNVMPLGNDLFGVRYLSLASVGLSFLAGYTVQEWAKSGKRHLAGLFVFIWLTASVVSCNLFHYGWRANIPFMEHVVSINTSGGLWQILAGMYYKDGRYQEAERSSRRAVEMEDDLADGWVTLGMAMAAQGKRMEAVAAWKKAVALEPHNGDASLNLAEYYESVHRTTGDPKTFELADSFYHTASHAKTRNGESAFVNRGVMWVNIDLKASAQIWREGLKQFPSSANLRRNLTVAERKLRVE